MNKEVANTPYGIMETEKERIYQERCNNPKYSLLGKHEVFWSYVIFLGCMVLAAVLIINVK